MVVVGQHFIFVESRAVYDLRSKIQSTLNFSLRLKMSLRFIHFTFISLTIRYIELVFCSVIDRLRSFTSGADRENLAVLRRPHLLTPIDLLHSYRTGPGCGGCGPTIQTKMCCH